MSEKDEYTGRFFGEIEGDLLESMLKENVFVMKTLYDYQALCSWDEFGNSSSTTIHTVRSYR